LFCNAYSSEQINKNWKKGEIFVIETDANAEVELKGENLPERGVWMWKKGTELEADLQRGL